MASSRSHDPSGKLTLFDLFTMVVAALGSLAGFRLGYATWGRGAAVVLAVGGFLVGAIIGRIPQAITLKILLRHLRRCDTATLREKLSSESYLSHFLVPVLRSRSEHETELQEKMLLLLLSESIEERWQAWRTVNLCFPDLAQRLRGVKPREAPQRYEGLVRQLLVELATHGPRYSHQSGM